MRLWQQLQSQVCNDKDLLSFTAVSCSIHFLMVGAAAVHFLLSDIKMHQALSCTFFIELPGELIYLHNGALDKIVTHRCRRIY